ncbi:MAG TPA: outer membrane beta-barrel protein [Rudaea sp.]|nr:outer membrane beta-barrel protein [Rudaea sp.]
MFKALVSLAISGIALPIFVHSSSAEASDAEKGGFFVDADVGKSTSIGSLDGSSSSYSGTLGYRWDVRPGIALGIEAGYKNIGHFEETITIPEPSGAVGPYSFRESSRGFFLGANGRFDLIRDWYLTSRLGAFRYHDEHSVIYDGTFSSWKDFDTGWYVGIGFGYDVNQNFSVGLNYNRSDPHNSDVGTRELSLSAEYRF